MNTLIGFVIFAVFAGVGSSLFKKEQARKAAGEKEGVNKNK